MKQALWAAAVLALVLILQVVYPPFQSPDEPHHFAAILMASKGGEAREWAEKETIRLMDRYDWWRPAGVGRPDPLPERISDITFLMDGSKSEDFLVRLREFVVYHKALGRVLRFLGIDRAETAYYFCRFVSLAFYLAAIGFIFATLRLLAGLWKIPLVQGLLLVAFLPQFALTSTSVGSDAFVVLLGAAFFWGAVRLIMGRGPAAVWALMLVGLAGAGLLADRSAFFMAALLPAVPFFVARPGKWKNTAVGALFLAILAVLLIYAAAMIFPLSVERILLTLKGVVGNAGQALPRLLAPDGFQARFWLFLMDTFFLRFGWLAFGAPVWITWAWRIVCLAAGIGLGVYAVESIRRRFKASQAGPAEEPAAEYATELSEEKGAARIRILLFALLGIAFQAAGLWVFYGMHGILSQGRYLFPLLGPLALIGTIGLHKLGSLIQPRRGGAFVLASGLVLEIFFLSYVVLAWILPTFNLTVQGHYPGI